MIIVRRVALLSIAFSFLYLQGCHYPHRYENEYVPPDHTVQGAFLGGFTGAGASAAFGTSVTSGIVAGTAVGGVLGYSSDTRLGDVRRLTAAGVRVIRYGDSVTIVLPSDIIFYRNSGRLNPDSYPYLVEIVGMMQRHASGRITIKAFSDNIGGLEHQLDLTQKQAQSVLAYCWSHGIDAHKLRAVGFGPQPDTADNLTVEGSAMNRRVEIHFRM